MSNFLRVLVAVVLVGVLLAVPITGAAAAPASLWVTAADSGKSFSVSPGEIIYATLQTNPSTGYTWMYLHQPNDPFVRFVSEKPALTDPTTESRLGTPKYIVFEFTVPWTAAITASSGSQEWLTMLSVQPWQPKLDGYSLWQIKLVFPANSSKQP